MLVGGVGAHVGRKLLDEREQHRLLQVARIEDLLQVRLLQRELDQRQVVGDERLVEGLVHLALADQVPNLVLYVEHARRLCLRTRHCGQHRVLQVGRLRFKALAHLWRPFLYIYDLQDNYVNN